ncbi:DEAD/DEAH box helicase [Gillisia limnaea]|uniref:DEAD/DEAH box helicase domain protein n=1 Tax=Gillisia limnaea (strain DSM 15749 / LMG 21470 / R-8282) TaxID=865937 RepID=H2BTX6_GILLR|nr:DEAD/DEAH box helicase [Gillisia limnaea]EHQ03790.1 DEAD/DEAH box helicase domain protein [Gillisia limnaea DSM 15749]
MTFEDLPLSKAILQGISEIGHLTPTPIQEKVIPEILRRNDVIAGAQTGTGKTGAFAIPLLNLLHKKVGESTEAKSLSVLIISPTRELAVQIEENIKAYAKYTNVKSGVVFGGASMQPQINLLKKGLHILVATPGRLLDLRKQGYINLDEIKVLVLDEADLMLDMGFIDEVQKIIRLSPNLEQRLMFSATIPAKVQDLAKNLLKDPEKIELTPNSSAAPDVKQLLFLVPKPDKTELMLFVMRNVIKEKSVLIFRRTKYGVEKALESLTKNGFKANALHGDMSQSDRSSALNSFKNKEINILVATDLAARGLDIDLLDYVLNFDIPSMPETYVHRIGRTGRAGNVGTSISFCSADEKKYIDFIETLIGTKIPVDNDNPYPMDKDSKPQIHKKKGSKHKPGRKGSGSKANKKRWY